MPHFGPLKRRELIGYLRRLGFAGPYSGGKHEFMQRGNLSVTIPNPHGREIGPKLLGKVLQQAGIGREQWESL